MAGYVTVLYCTVLYCTVLYCTVLYCTVLYCTPLLCSACAIISFIFSSKQHSLFLLLHPTHSCTCSSGVGGCQIQRSIWLLDVCCTLGHVCSYYLRLAATLRLFASHRTHARACGHAYGWTCQIMSCFSFLFFAVALRLLVHRPRERTEPYYWIGEMELASTALLEVYQYWFARGQLTNHHRLSVPPIPPPVIATGGNRLVLINDHFGSLAQLLIR